MDDVLLRTSPEYNEFRQEILRAIHLLDTSIAAHRPTIVTESYLTGEEAVAYEVVGVGAHAARVAVEVLHIFELGRGEGVDDRQQNPLPAF